MNYRLAVAIVITCLCGTAFAQAPPPDLTRQQRELLQAIVTAVDAAATQPETAGLSWQHHIMRASDGSHYVAFSAEPPPAAPLPAGNALLYVRLATAAPAGGAAIAERSPVREWLAGRVADPRLLPRRNIAIGDMPAFGPSGTIGVRSSTPSTGSNEMRLMALERERQRQEQQDRDKQRRNEFEGKQASARNQLPFEDFDLAARSTRPDGTRIIARAFTAGPGDYDLYLGWADPSASKPAGTIRVVRKSISLEPARTVGLITSQLILADSVSVRAEPYAPAEQASHPYSIGLMEIVPARTHQYTRDSHLSVAFQIINAQSNNAGMPDVGVAFRIVRVTGERESAVASLNPHSYNATTLPPEFNLQAGHPLFAAVTAPLATLTRGNYRLKVTVSDRIANTTASTEAAFSVIATPASLLAEAPPLGPAFTRDTVMGPDLLRLIVETLTPAAPSPALARALAVARAGKLVDLLVEEPVPAQESAVRTVLTGLALLSIGDASAAVQFQRALQQNAPVAPAQFLLGAARAMQMRDADAIAAWQTAIATGAAPPITAQLLAEAYLRRNDPQRASDVAGGVTQPAARTLAAIHIANSRETAAIALLEIHLAAQPADRDAQWLLLHALYAEFVRGGQRLRTADLARFAAVARTYIEAGGAHAALAAEWLKVISSA